MRIFARCMLAVCVAVGGTCSDGLAAQNGAPRQSAPTEQQVAAQAAGTWLGLVDAEQYQKSWNEAAEVFKSAVTAEKWVSAMKTVRGPLGKLQSRKMDSADYTKTLPGVPDGEYVVVLYETVFEHKAEAQETVIMSRAKDKMWRVAGYYIK